jgi:hypothetical protein
MEICLELQTDTIRQIAVSNCSNHTKALGLTQPLTEISPRDLPGGKEQTGV